MVATDKQNWKTSTVSSNLLNLQLKGEVDFGKVMCDSIVKNLS